MFNSRKCIKPTTKIFIHSVFESHMDGIIGKINYSPFCWGPSGKGPTWRTTAVEYFFLWSTFSQYSSNNSRFGSALSSSSVMLATSNLGSSDLLLGRAPADLLSLSGRLSGHCELSMVLNWCPVETGSTSWYRGRVYTVSCFPVNALHLKQRAFASNVLLLNGRQAYTVR